MRDLIRTVALGFTLCVSAAGAEPTRDPGSFAPLPSRDAPILLAEQKVWEIAKVKVDRAGRIYFCKGGGRYRPPSWQHGGERPSAKASGEIETRVRRVGMLRPSQDVVIRSSAIKEPSDADL